MFKLPELNYDYGALKEFVGAETMRAHHDHHHQTYVDKLNAAILQVPEEIRKKYFGGDFRVGEIRENAAAGALAETESLAKFLEEIRAGKLDEKIDANLRQMLINQGGGHVNHSLFWQVLTPKSGGEPTGELAKKLSEKYGGFQNFANLFEAAATGIFGSGWAWLSRDLEIETSRNQDLAKAPVLIGLDVWEHAYYLDYKWNRADYVKAFWSVANWELAEKRFEIFAKK